MLIYSSRSDLKQHMAAGHEARSRAFFDLLNWMTLPIAKAWAQINLVARRALTSIFKHKNQPSGQVHA